MMPLTAQARYLFHQVGVNPGTMPPHEVIARAAGPILELLHRWWSDLEPEATAGVTAPMMEDALVAFADKAVTKGDQTWRRRWARSWFNWKPGLMQSGAEQAIGERFLATATRLGVLAPRGSRVAFSHHTLLELFLGVGLQRRAALPDSVRSAARTSLVPLMTTQGRAVLARLYVETPDAKTTAFKDVATQNLHLATWFLYCDDAARAEHGEWLVGELLAACQWGQSTSDREALVQALLSLGAAALNPGRAFLDERRHPLTAYPAAIDAIRRWGTAVDEPRLARVIADPLLGQWEIDQLRQVIRDAEAHVLDATAQKRYTRQEMSEFAKTTSAIVMKIVGTVASEASDPFPSGRNTAIHIAGSILDHASDHLAEASPSEFYQSQRVLRELLGHLPQIIERRKIEIATLVPIVRNACDTARAAIRRTRLTTEALDGASDGTVT